MRMSRIAAALAALLFALAPSGLAPVVLAAERETVIVTTEAGEHTFNVEIADDPREQERGLMFRRSMADDEGMLFPYAADRRASFWMRNTYIPLDIIFIEADGTIESIAERTTPLSERSIRSKGPVRFVLEINGGLSDTLGISAGDKVGGPAIETRQ